MKDLVEFFKKNPEHITEYIAYKEQCIRGKAKLAFDMGISLEEFENKLENDLLNALNEKN